MTNTLPDRLLPCPFCGGQAQVIRSESDGTKYSRPHFIVRCPSVIGAFVSDCYGNYTNLWDITPKNAEERWNRRACIAANAAAGAGEAFSNPYPEGAQAYIDTDTGSVCVDWTDDPQRAFSLIIKRTGEVRYAMYVNGKRGFGPAHSDAFMLAVSQWADPRNEPSNKPTDTAIAERDRRIAELDANTAKASAYYNLIERDAAAKALTDRDRRIAELEDLIKFKDKINTTCLAEIKSVRDQRDTATKALTEMLKWVRVMQAENLRIIKVNKGYTSEYARGEIAARTNVSFDIDGLLAALDAKGKP